MRDMAELFAALGKSPFRRKFHLGDNDLRYLSSKGLSVILEHAEDFVAMRLAPAAPANDGKQTPFRGHPVFVAQHATACCCRQCLEKWHHIPRGHTLNPAEKTYILAVLEHWLKLETRSISNI